MDDTHNTKTGVGSASRVVRRPPPPQSGQKKRLNWPYALLSLVIGTLLWFGVDLKRMEDATLDVKVNYPARLPDNWKFVTTPAPTVKVSVRGSRQEVGSISKDQVKIEAELPPGMLEGDVYNGPLALLPNQIQGFPAGVEVTAITPSNVQVNLARTVTHYLTVEAGPIVGKPAEGFAVGRVSQIDPPSVSVTTSQDVKFGSNDRIYTREINVDGLSERLATTVELQPIEKDGDILEVNPGAVFIIVELDEEPVEREFPEPFEVRALIDSPFDRYPGLNISPPSVKVAVSGPKSVIDRMSPGEIIIYADIRDRVPAAAGEYNLRCRAITPSRVRVTRIEPDTVKWITREGAAAEAPALAPLPPPPGIGGF